MARSSDINKGRKLLSSLGLEGQMQEAVSPEPRCLGFPLENGQEKTYRPCWRHSSKQGNREIYTGFSPSFTSTSCQDLPLMGSARSRLAKEPGKSTSRSAVAHNLVRDGWEILRRANSNLSKSLELEQVYL